MKKTINLNGVDVKLKFENGFAVVVVGEKYNYVNTDGELLSPEQWFDNAYNFTKGGIAHVIINDKQNLINKEGELIFKDIDISYIDMYNDEVYHRIYTQDGTMTYIKPNGEFAFGSEVWFNEGNRFSKKERFIAVCKNDKWNFIDADGNFLFRKWLLDYAESFCMGFAMVRLHGRENYVNMKGELLSKDGWFDEVEEHWFHKEYVVVTLYGKEYLLNKKGDLYVGKWYSEEPPKRVEWPRKPILPSTLP